MPLASCTSALMIQYSKKFPILINHNAVKIDGNCINYCQTVSTAAVAIIWIQMLNQLRVLAFKTRWKCLFGQITQAHTYTYGIQNFIKNIIFALPVLNYYY